MRRADFAGYLRSDRRCVYASKNYVPTPSLAGKSDDAVEQWINSGHMISAIKLYREVHSCGLREAKFAVEALIEKIKK